MGEVLWTMTRRLPAARVLLEKVQTLRQRLKDSPGEDDHRRLSELCAGDEPATVEDNLRAFVAAVESRKATVGIAAWVKIGALLAKGA